MILTRIAALAAILLVSMVAAQAKPISSKVTCYDGSRVIACGVLEARKEYAGYQPTKKSNKRTRNARIETGERYLPHPAGCPHIAFCACGASVEIFGKAIRSLWPARAWYKYPRSSPGYKMVAVRNHHVMVLISHVDGNDWLVHDYNSGGHKSREHVRSISGYKIVNPSGSLAQL